MKSKVSSSLLLPQPPLPPCLLEIAPCVLRRSRCGQLQRRARCSLTPQLPARQLCSSINPPRLLNQYEREKICSTFGKKLLLPGGPQVSPENAREFVVQPGRAPGDRYEPSEGHRKRGILSPSHPCCEATHNTKLIKASTGRRRNVPFGKFRSSWLVLPMTSVLPSVELTEPARSFWSRPSRAT